MPTIDQLLQYLEKRQQLLEVIKGTSNTSSRSSSTFSKRSTLHKTMSHNCILCNKDHAQHKCEHFKIMKLCPGSKIQPDWGSFLFRWGKHRYVFIVDIEKNVPANKCRQKLSRFSTNSPATRTYTYGTASATSLAIRAIQQLVDNEGKTLSVTKEVLKQDFYVGGMLTEAEIPMPKR